MAPRKAKRLKVTVATQIHRTNEQSNQVSRTRKRGTGRASSLRGRRGSLANLSKMPMDVIFEVGDIKEAFTDTALAHRFSRC